MVVLGVSWLYLYRNNFLDIIIFCMETLERSTLLGGRGRRTGTLGSRSYGVPFRRVSCSNYVLGWLWWLW